MKRCKLDGIRWVAAPALFLMASLASTAEAGATESQGGASPAARFHHQARYDLKPVPAAIGLQPLPDGRARPGLGLRFAWLQTVIPDGGERDGKRFAGKP